VRALALFLVLAALPALGAEEKTVTLHEKDADVRDILKSMQKQCGIRNLVIDPDVAGKGTLYFKQVPCATAFRVVFGQFGLAGQPDPNVLFVQTRRR
jgi:type II secretory pathway component GspD/PulD (secretin)